MFETHSLKYSAAITVMTRIPTLVASQKLRLVEGPSGPPGMGLRGCMLGSNRCGHLVSMLLSVIPVISASLVSVKDKCWGLSTMADGCHCEANNSVVARGQDLEFKCHLCLM